MGDTKPKKTEPKEKKPDIVVFMSKHAQQCDECHKEIPRGDLLQPRGDGVSCLDCADLGHLVYLPSGDTALTRRATKHSTLRAVVLRWSSSRKRNERQGILVEKDALRRAQDECEGDAGVRAAERERAAVRREHQDRAYMEEFALAVRGRYPSCPEGDESEIAEHACERYSGRVGRTSAAKSLDPKTIELAVGAHIRHLYTDYDEHLMVGMERDEARRAVTSKVRGILAEWAKPSGPAR